MKKYIIFLIMLVFATATFAQYPINNRTVGNSRQLVRLLQSRFDALDDDLAEAGGLYNIGTGNIRYVDSGRSNATTIDGLTKAKAEPTLEAAFAQATNGLTANNGDIVYVIQDHEENFAAADAADMDVAGVTVVNLGEGDDAPGYTYTATGGELVVGAANITFIGGQLIAGISAITMGVSVEDAGDNFTMIGTEFPEPSTVTFDFLDAIDLASGADGFEIYHCIYRHVSTTGPTHFIDAGNGPNAEMKIINNDIRGEFSVAAIWSDTIDLNATIAWNIIFNNTSAQHAIEFTTTATGMIMHNAIYTDASATSIDPGSMMCIENYVGDTINQSANLYPAAGS
jgi:hypothetical protein